MKDDTEVYSILLRTYNRWWESGTIESVPPYRRADFFPLWDKLKGDLPIILIGARQVGKTTLINQLIQQLLKEGTPKENIFYVDLGNYAINNNCDDPLLDTVRVYQQYVLKKDFNDSGRVYLFFDEIQKRKGWSEFAKDIYGAYKGKVKIVLTGSSSLSILQTSEETLAGRYEKQAVVPLKFSEAFRFKRFISASKVKDSNPKLLPELIAQNDKLRFIDYDLRKSLEESIRKKQPQLFFEMAKQASIKLTTLKPELVGFFNEYLIKGGYPEIISNPEIEKCDRILQTYLSDIIAKDFLGDLRKPESLEILLYILAHNTGRKIDVSRVCETARIKKPTYYSYLSALKKVCLIYSLERLPTSLYGKAGNIPKIYLNDVGLRNSLVRKMSPAILTENLGELVETVVCDHLLRLSFKWSNYVEPEVYYWSDKKGKETDFIVKTQNLGSLYLPLECKYSDNPDNLKGIMSFLEDEKGNAPFGIVLTKDSLTYDEGRRLLFIPIYLFLLLC